MRLCFFFFFQAEDGIRDAQESRGLGDVYKRQEYSYSISASGRKKLTGDCSIMPGSNLAPVEAVMELSLIHI